YFEKGELAPAASALRDALEMARAQKDAGLTVHVGAQLATVLLETDLAAARAVADELARAAGPDVGDEIRGSLAALRVVVQMEQGDVQAARRDVDALLASARPGLVQAQAFLARAALDNDAHLWAAAEQAARSARAGSTLLAPIADLELAEALIGQSRF